MNRFQILVATKKGLLIGESDYAERGRWQFRDPAFLGWQVDFAMRDSRNGRVWAALSHMQWGPHLHYSDDGGDTWEESEAPSFTSVADGDASLERIWTIEPGAASEPDRIYAGVDPAALFISDDGGKRWEICNALWNHESREQWSPGAAGLTLHHIQIDPRDPAHIYVAVSAAGTFETVDAGHHWAPRNRGVAADYLPRRGEEEVGQCVHNLALHPAQPDRLYQRSHDGVYRSDDGGGRWRDIGAGLPSAFGFAATIDPHDAETYFVIPLQFDQARVPVEGRLRVYRTSDGGATWLPLEDGLPQGNAFQGVYRQALTTDTATPLGVYFGTSGGHVYASQDGGATWRELLDHLAPVTAVRVNEIAG
jgi:hypothetical protein